jgi:hypothetical protein
MVRGKLVLVILSSAMLYSCATLPRERAKRDVIACTKDLMDYTKNMSEAFSVCDKVEKEY